MSLFNRNHIIEIQRKDQSTFQIPQFVKIEGLKKDEIKKFKSSDFISPIFGLSVKDETVAPFVIKDTGDIRKRYDAFRNKPMTDLGAYAEFKSLIINNESRKKIFVKYAVVNKNRKYKNNRKKKFKLKFLLLRNNNLKLLLTYLNMNKLNKKIM